MSSLNEVSDAPDATTSPKAKMSVDEAVEHARRAFALKQYEKAVEHYASALESMTNQRGDDAPETADLYFYYGKALLENAISQSSVLGKEQEQDRELEHEQPTASGSGSGGPIILLPGDAEEEEEPATTGEDAVVDMFGEAIKATADEEAVGGDEDEPEDDFNAAWEVLELARAIYDKQQKEADESERDEVKLKLAETYITLGDVSLETEKFDQAITDYSAGLALKTDLLPISSRQIAEAHYKLSMVLDLTPGRLSDAIVHAEKALESVDTRLAELRDGLQGQFMAADSEGEDLKGKAKSWRWQVAKDDRVQDMAKPQMEAEVKDLEGLREDLALKVEELKTSPSEPTLSAPALVAQALDRELNARGSLPLENQTVVNDLTSMVIKKKKHAPQDNGTKRKADEDAETSSEKKAKID